jgi:hypothetical protein
LFFLRVLRAILRLLAIARLSDQLLQQQRGDLRVAELCAALTISHRPLLRLDALAQLHEQARLQNRSRIGQHARGRAATAAAHAA